MTLLCSSSFMKPETSFMKLLLGMNMTLWVYVDIHNKVHDNGSKMCNQRLKSLYILYLQIFMLHRIFSRPYDILKNALITLCIMIVTVLRCILCRKCAIKN